MPRPTSTKPPVSAWIVRERKRLRLKPEDVAARLTAMGLPVEVGTVRTWEAGRRPHPDNIEGLERIFGAESPTEPEPLAALASALTGQTAVISELVDFLRPLVGHVESNEARIRAIEAELESLRARRGGGGSQGRSSLPTRAGSK